MKCALCQIGERGEDSHIIPAFAFRWLKKSSITGYMRQGGENPKRVQDGKKVPLLCAKCEATFSSYETIFAERVFHKVTKEGNCGLHFTYEDWFPRFCVSLSWRAMSYIVENEDKLSGKFPYGHAQYIQRPLETWRKYLLGLSPDVGPFRQHFMILDVPISGVPAHELFDFSAVEKGSCHESRQILLWRPRQHSRLTGENVSIRDMTPSGCPC